MTLTLDRYEANAFRAIQGWLQEPVLWALKVITAFHEEQNIRGNVCEIGIHHGRFFLALENVTRREEKCVAIDIFEDQDRNVDRSGLGSESIFRENLTRHALHPDRVLVKNFNSTSHTARRFFAEADPVRLFSVDGGHTVAHVANDLRLAEGCLADGGIVFLDDWFNPAFPSVTEGLANYLVAGTALVPVVGIGGKLLLTGVSWYPAWIKTFKAALKDTDFKAKTVRFQGYDYWHIWKG